MNIFIDSFLTKQTHFEKKNDLKIKIFLETKNQSQKRDLLKSVINFSKSILVYDENQIDLTTCCKHIAKMKNCSCLES